MYFINSIFKQIFPITSWSRLSVYLGLIYLIAERKNLYKNNLHNTFLNLPKCDIPKEAYEGRMADGSCNDLDEPMMGAKGTPFCRNIPLDKLVPLDERRLIEPNPRLISEKLLARKEFIPATSLNLLAAAWIQFMTHDWFASHDTNPKKNHVIPLDDKDSFPEKPMTVDETLPASQQDFPGSITYNNVNSHWWDGTQIYGKDNDALNDLRTFIDGKLKIQEDGRLCIDPKNGLELTGIQDNWWTGLSMLHNLFTREHNAICDHLKKAHPDFDDTALFMKARLINTAVMAKIHTVEWTPGILSNPILVKGMNINWSGLLGEGKKRKVKFRHHLLTGLVGDKVNHFGYPFSLSEEFVAVYRLHSLLPDFLSVASLNNDKETVDYPLIETTAKKARDVIENHSMEDILYSMGISHPGALCLHNYPNYLRELRRQKDGKLIDLAAVDIIRDRERQIPRYNEFRRCFSLEPAASFEDLTQDQKTADELKEVYNDIEDVDLLIGCLSEKYPYKFGFGETAFQLFLLMASRRFTSDRFFASDFNDDVYTKEGMEWIYDADMSVVLLRHFPQLNTALNGVSNAFSPWSKTR